MWLLCDTKTKEILLPLLKISIFLYFKIKLGDQDKELAPHVVCKTCAENLTVVQRDSNVM
jgi:hypothetical protein